MATTEFRAVGQRMPRVDSIERVKGTAIYGTDLARPGTLYGSILRSPHAHARIVRIDTSRAAALPGVKAIVTGGDMPRPEEAAAHAGGEVTLELQYLWQFFLAQDRALFHGHPVAAVAAVDPHTAEEALRLIDVEYEPLPPVLDIVEAMKSGSPAIHPGLRTKTMGPASDQPTNVAVHMEIERGDVEQGFREADVVIEREYKVGMVHQGYIEPQACTVEVDATGHVTIYTTTQAHFGVRSQIASLLGLPLNKVKVVPLEIGGGFGGKALTVPELPATLLAMKAGRPVKMVLSRDEVFRATGPAPDSYSTIRIGAKRDGTVTGFQASFVFNAGCLPGSALYVNNVLVAGLSPYRFPNLRADGYDVVTNKPRSQAYRAPGMPNGVFAIEMAMDEMAEQLGMDPIDLRLKNVTEDGGAMTDGMPLPVTRLREILESVKAHPAWTSPVPPGHGRGVALGMRKEGFGTSSAQMTLNGDGTLALTIGSVDLTGVRTSIAQWVAEELGVRPADISVSMGDTDSVGHTDGSWGSRVTYVTGTAAVTAARDLIEKLKKHLAPRFRVEPDAIEYRDRTFFVRDNPEQKLSLREAAAANTGQGAGAIVGVGVASGLRPITSTAVHIAEATVDRDTGRAVVTRYTAFQDPGVAINPMEIEGQIQGAVAQGIGWALWEEYAWDQSGVMRNATFLDYRMPTFLDTPRVEVVFVGGPAPENPRGVRGVGEAPIIPPLPAIGNAVARAIGTRIREIPMTPERVHQALNQQ